MKSKHMKLQFLNTVSLDIISGGNIYNKMIIEGLRQKGIEIDYNTKPVDKDYDLTLVDSLCMDEIDPSNLKRSKQIIALIHQIPKLSSSTLDFYRTHTKFIVTGEPTKLELINLWQVNKKHIRVLRPGVPDSWKPKTVFKDQPKRIIIVSNFIQNKGFETLVDILKHFNHIDLTFHVVGNDQIDKEYANTIINTIQKTSDNVKFYFNLSRDEVYTQLMQSDIFLSLSKSETFGMSLFEALTMGLPCLAYKTGDYNYFSNYDNYALLNVYSKNNFIEVIEQWLTKSKTYKQYCNTSSKNNRSWQDVTEEFSIYIKNNTIAC